MHVPASRPAMAAAAAAALAACTPATSPNSFSRNEAGQVMPVAFGRVIAVRGVEIRPGQTRLGAVTGALLGGVGGSQIGSSTAANVAGAVAGAAAGGAVGSAIQGSQRSNGVELTIRLESGESVAVVQPGDPRHYRVGDRVRLTGTADNARVTRASGW
ncbi:glycine zipper 2TM domain-containing protein [Sphingosinicella terrae]|uniref:glycine zipper 2TM domain-containing protein n=1 Tax=Sphingosinicella terrae TaxID=2172047 RepID=UPI0013B36B3F|nr:glycine zipper 2TM domain-containing protein [Sphingosinicella terrae]